MVAATDAAVVLTQEQREEQLTQVTLEADRFATVYLSALLAPIVVGFVLRSLVYERHLSWYSWAIGALTGCVYAFGFVLMCPQLYINHKLKSVSHLPWNVSTCIQCLFIYYSLMILTLFLILFTVFGVQVSEHFH